jgi:hypothetical protein
MPERDVCNLHLLITHALQDALLSSISSPLLTPPIATVERGLGRCTTQTLWEATILRLIQEVLNLYLIEG